MDGAREGNGKLWPSVKRLSRRQATRRRECIKRAVRLEAALVGPLFGDPALQDSGLDIPAPMEDVEIVTDAPMNIDGTEEPERLEKCHEDSAKEAEEDEEESSEEEHRDAVPTEETLVKRSTTFEDEESLDDHELRITSGKDEASIPEVRIEGRRIVDISFMFDQIKEKFQNHGRPFDCTFFNLNFIGSKQFGLKTKITIRCSMCNYVDSIWTEANDSSQVDINRCAVAGCMSTGIGYFQMQEYHAGMAIPAMSKNTFRQLQDDMVQQHKATAEKEMKAAAEMERATAIELGDVARDGTPCIAVIVDGSWMKRSYPGGRYDSPSGTGVIIGGHHQKVLYVGVRNKRCAVCETAEKRRQDPTDHRCYRNFDKKAASSAMEAHAIVEGFRTSIATHGLIYNFVIGDGDSSVYKAILDENPYADYNIHVRKIECVNHLFRNLTKKVRNASTIRGPGTAALRRVVENSSLKIRREITLAISRRAQEDDPLPIKMRNLQRDIMAVPRHVYGDHASCRDLNICDGVMRDDERNLVPELEELGLFQQVQTAASHFSCHAESLLKNETINPAESFNAIICKCVGGKRINFGMRGQYEARVYAAVTQFNTQRGLSALHENLGKEAPAILVNLEKSRQRKVLQNRLNKLNKPSRRYTERATETDRHYGPGAQKPDMEKEVYDELLQQHLAKLQRNQADREAIEEKTREQSACALWHSLRKDVLTASNFGIVCRSRRDKKWQNKLKEILYFSVKTAAMEYGRRQEETARKELEAEFNVSIEKSGFIIDKNVMFFGASPDGKIGDDGLVEIKCPHSARKYTPEEALEKLQALRRIFSKTDVNKLNEKHAYYYQVQGQLHIAEREYCLFVLWTPLGFKVTRVTRDDDFWDRSMKPLLVEFYLECMLPEIIDSRRARGMPFRIYEVQPRMERDVENVTLEARQPEAADGSAHESPACDSSGDAAQEATGQGESTTEDLRAALRAFDRSVTLETRQPEAADVSAHESPACDSLDDAAQEATGQDESTTKDLRAALRAFDRDATIEEVAANVLPLASDLDDKSIDKFLDVVRSYDFDVQSTLILVYPEFWKPYTPGTGFGVDLQIIGGNTSRHWHCLFFDGETLRIYDSMFQTSYDRLANEEKKYIRTRYPGLPVEKVQFQAVQKQPDNHSCGVYAAAFATTLALGGDPTTATYSNDANKMREHFLLIVEQGELIPFPCQ